MLKDGGRAGIVLPDNVLLQTVPEKFSAKNC
nr:SAM-dependent methyltransferase [Treponema denticola]